MERDLRDLVAGMNALTGDDLIDLADLERQIVARDRQLANPYSKDGQVTAIHGARAYWADKVTRVATPHRILDPDAGPLVAVRLSILTRKSLGGLQTDLDGRVLTPSGEPLDGLYAAGEVAGFGGGGMHGYRALEGTFLGGCLFSGRTAGRAAARAVAVTTARFVRLGPGGTTDPTASRELRWSSSSAPAVGSRRRPAPVRTAGRPPSRRPSRRRRRPQEPRGRRSQPPQRASRPGALRPGCSGAARQPGVAVAAGPARHVDVQAGRGGAARERPGPAGLERARRAWRDGRSWSTADTVGRPRWLTCRAADWAPPPAANSRCSERQRLRRAASRTWSGVGRPSITPGEAARSQWKVNDDEENSPPRVRASVDRGTCL